MKRILALMIALLLVIPVLPVAHAAEPVTINVYNWGQYISDGSDGYPDLNAKFTEETGIEVNYMTFDTNESMYTKLKTGGSTFDIVVPSDYMAGRLIAEGMVQEINYDNIPNYKYIDENYRNTAYDPDNRYTVPYTGGMVGIIYNTKYVSPEDVGGWDLLWNSKYSGKILMFDNCRDAFAIAERSLGYSMNTTDETELRNCAELLATQKPLVQSYVMDQIFDKMVREEAWIAPYYAGDYLFMVQDNPDLAFCYPEEGFNLFIDCFCIPTSAQNKEAAEAYINFMLDPENCGPNLEYLGYSAAESAAKEYMDPEVANNPIAYPDAQTLSRSESFVALPTESSQLMDSLWLSVKTGGNGDDILTSITLGGIILLVVVCTANSMDKKHRKARRGTYYKKES